MKNGKVGQNAKIRVIQVGNRFATAEIVDGASGSSEDMTTLSAPPASEQSSS